MANIQLFDKLGNEINPKTLAGLVILSGGGSVEEKIVALEAALSGQTGCHVVADIEARDALTGMNVGDQAWVIDATGDSTVSTGGAKYIYQSKESGWVKTLACRNTPWADIGLRSFLTVCAA